jgi:predicted DNA-binding transcriptional regulator AlpA
LAETLGAILTSRYLTDFFILLAEFGNFWRNIVSAQAKSHSGERESQIEEYMAFNRSELQQDLKLVLREEEAAFAIGLCAQTLHNRCDESSSSFDPSFPAPIALGSGNGSRVAIGWRRSELVNWVNTRPRAVGLRQLNKRVKSIKEL